MSEFKFNMVAGLPNAAGIYLRAGFSAEVETANRWATVGGVPRAGTFITVPSGPVMVASLGPAPGGVIWIAESDNPLSVAQWGTGNTPIPQPANLNLRSVNVAPGVPFKSFLTFGAAFVAMRCVGTGATVFNVEAFGIPERAPATLLYDLNPSLIAPMA